MAKEWLLVKQISLQRMSLAITGALSTTQTFLNVARQLRKEVLT